ncbi:DUF4890 domain-containing protein [Hymenobacter sp. BT175]|uniref:DUF4890 domain-containing protein n=1 Tax=Hymenobacter translucens TaxID=2886507 RepID=UPI001D0EAD02|nr:DUF4890 domain-containing protein [Hymenobacter translucens]MCC2545463.1 DUF4890 domain-containing protein [Hymenobacter translucens]
MKKNLILLAAFLLTGGAATAQTQATQSANDGQGQMERAGQTPDERAARQTERLSKELGLTADQSTRIRQILLSREQEMQAMRGKREAGTDRQALGQEMKASRARYDAQFKEVLTAEQYTRFTQLKHQRMERGGPKVRAYGQLQADSAKVVKQEVKARSKSTKTKIKTK